MNMRQVWIANAIVLALASWPALAQNQRQAGAPGGQGGPGQRGGMRGGGMFGGSPIQSAALNLLGRPDVQNEIRLDLKQKNAMTELGQTAGQEMRQQMGQLFQGQRGQNNQNQTPEERQQRMQEMRQQMQAQMTQFQGQLSEKALAILHPDQVKRLHQLDLQWRGPLAMADPKVAEEIKLSQESRTAVLKIYQEYDAAVQQARQQMFEQMRQNGGFGGNRGQGGQPGQPGAQPPNQQDLQNRLNPVRQQMDKMKKEAEEKVLAAITQDELGRWKAALGEPFTFREDQAGTPGGFFGGPGGGFGGPGGGGGFGGRGGRRGGRGNPPGGNPPPPF